MRRCISNGLPKASAGSYHCRWPVLAAACSNRPCTAHVIQVMALWVHNVVRWHGRGGWVDAETPPSEGCTLGSRAIANGYSLRHCQMSDAILSSWSDRHMCMMQAESRRSADILSLTSTGSCRFKALTERAAGCLDC